MTTSENISYNKSPSRSVKVFSLLVAILSLSPVLPLFYPAARAQEVPSAPAITAQPADLSVAEGEDAAFTVEATGSGTLDYQWSVDGTTISDATDSTLILEAVDLGDAGTVYSVQITDDNGSIVSDGATLEVMPVSIAIVGQGTLDSGRQAGPRWISLDLEALATAVHTVTVSWDTDADVRFKVQEENGGSLSSTLQGTNPGVWTGELEADGQYFIGLWSADGVANYIVKVETSADPVDPELAITAQPTDLTVAEGGNATFSITASGSGTFSYQWFADGLAIPGETSDSLTVMAITLEEDGTGYRAQVSNTVEVLTSEVATLTVRESLSPGMFSREADASTWILSGPAPTLDFNVSNADAAWGRVLLRIGEVLLVGGDFTGIRPARGGPVTDRPWLAALNAISGQPESTFQVPSRIDGVVRALALSPDGSQVYVGGDFGFLALNATTGAIEFEVDVARGARMGRVFDIAVTPTQMYIGGDFTAVDEALRENVARLSLDGELDGSWRPGVEQGFRSGREAPVQSITVSPSEDVIYVGGNFRFINGTPVPRTRHDTTISLLAVSTSDDGTVRSERFTPIVNEQTQKSVKVRDIAVTENYVIVAWGGPNYLTFHSLDGTRLVQYQGTGDVQALKVVGDLVYVGHHGEFFGSLPNPIPPEAYVSADPEIIRRFRLHSFRIDDPSFLPEDSWEASGLFGVWGIAVSEDSVWLSGQLISAGSNGRLVDGLVRFSALD